MIAGFETPTAGEVLLNGRLVNDLKPYERNVSTVFQSYALFPHLTARGNIEFGLRRTGAKDIDRRVKEVLELVGLLGKEMRKPAQLSGGERQRVALARSLVLQPEVLLLDEPLAALDPKLRKQMRAELKAMQRRVGITFLLVTHDQEEALSMSDQLAVMNAGLIEQVGTPEDVYLRPKTAFVATFLGGLNWMGGVGVRPEATWISRDAETRPCRQVCGTVETSVFLGDCIQVFVRLENGERAIAQLPRSSANYQPGEQVRICWDLADEMSFQ
jgi:ABC-type Fe3+/spermidine/putrescine transport system ATPase subunit